ALHRRRLQHVAPQVDGRAFGKDVHYRRLGIGHQYHVGLVDSLPSGDRRSVEHLSVLEDLLGNYTRGYGYVLFLALRVGKAKVDELDVLFLDQAEYLSSGHIVISSRWSLCKASFGGSCTVPEQTAGSVPRPGPPQAV